jgi:HlyD family secretion protein
MSALSNPTPSPAQPAPPRVAPVARPEPPKKDFPWKGWTIAAIIMIGAWAGYQFWLKPQQERAAQKAAAIVYRTAKVTVGPFQRNVRISGTTGALKFANIATPRPRGDRSSQMELLKLVKSGSWVEKGDIVAQIDPGFMIDHADDTKATHQQSQADLEKRRAEQMVEMESVVQTVRVAQAQVTKAGLDNQAAEVRTDVEREILKLALEEAQAKHKQSELDLPLKKIVHDSELRILGFTIDRHQRHIEKDTIQLKSYAIYSPMKGMVVLSSTYRGGGESQQVQQGDQLGAGQPLMKIVDPASMQVEASINQTESTEMRIGLPATIGFDAFPGFTLKGKVYSIGALAAGGMRQNYFIRTVPIKLTIDGGDPRLIPDLSAWADVAVESKDRATLLPLSAVHNEDGKTFVFLKSGETWSKREVALRGANNLFAVATAGVNEGDEVRLK